MSEQQLTTSQLFNKAKADLQQGRIGEITALKILRFQCKYTIGFALSCTRKWVREVDE